MALRAEGFAAMAIDSAQAMHGWAKQASPRREASIQSPATGTSAPAEDTTAMIQPDTIRPRTQSTDRAQRDAPLGSRMATAALVLALVVASSACAGVSAEGAPTTNASGGGGSTASGDQLLAALDHGLRPTVLQPGQSLPGWSLQERMAHHHVPGVAIAVLRDGKVVAVKGYGVREAGTQDAVDGETLFNVGSVSKVVAAATSLRLVASGRLELDRDVNHYLRSWQVPPAPGNGQNAVTLRMLMSHTAGFNVHGFPDFAAGAAAPTLVETLEGTSPAANEALRFKHAPGLLGDYSGGGVTVEQLLVEDVTGASFDAVARSEVFSLVGMRRSTFADPSPGHVTNIAKAHDGKGAVTGLPRGWQVFPQQAAAGLWTTAGDLGAFVGTLIRSYQGRDAFLPRAIAVQMMTEVSPSWHGLGPRLDGAGATRIFHHGGSNDSYHALFEGYLETGDGFVVLTNGENGWALRGEIRNALSDAIGLGVNPPVRTIALDPDVVAVADYAGRYRLDANFPLAQRRALADDFDFDTLDVGVNGDALSISTEDEKGALLALSPSRFVAPTVFNTQYQFHRDAHGRVIAVSVELGGSRAYYRREGA